MGKNLYGAVPFNGHGLAWYGNNDYDRALADFDQALGLDPKAG